MLTSKAWGILILRRALGRAWKAYRFCSTLIFSNPPRGLAQNKNMKNLLLILMICICFCGCKKAGCKDEEAYNYDSAAEEENGSCKYMKVIYKVKCIYCAVAYSNKEGGIESELVKNSHFSYSFYGKSNQFVQIQISNVDTSASEIGAYITINGHPYKEATKAGLYASTGISTNLPNR